MEEFESLLQLTGAMRAAAGTGDFEKIAELLKTREVQLNSVLEQGAEDLKVYEVLSQVLAQDKEIISLILKEQDRIRAELTKLRAGRRMRSAYFENDRPDEA